MSTDNPWVTHSTRTVYSNPWITVREDEVTTPGGTPGIYGVVEYANRAVGVVPIDDDANTWLVGQYRYAHERYEWEIPEGGAAPGENLAACAHRELLEETGLDAGRIEPLIGNLQLSNSTSNECAWLFTAHELTAGVADLDDTEQIATQKIPLSDAIAMVERGEIRDIMSVAALLLLRERIR